MDPDRARELAVAEFADRNLIVDEWDVTGPREMLVAGFGGREPVLAFDFVPRPEHDPAGERLVLRIVVDPVSGGTDMLR